MLCSLVSPSLLPCNEKKWREVWKSPGAWKKPGQLWNAGGWEVPCREERPGIRNADELSEWRKKLILSNIKKKKKKSQADFALEGSGEAHDNLAENCFSESCDENG